jgi:hypothetical protein
MDGVVDALTAQGAVYNALNAAYSGGAFTDGTSDSTAAIQAALNATPAGQSVYLPPGITYRTSAPLTIPNGVSIRSQARGLGSPIDAYGLGSLPVTGAILKPLSSFSGAAVLLMDNSAGLTQMGNQQIIGISIDGSALTGGNTVNGIESIGAVAAVTIDSCFVYLVGGHGVYASLDSAFRPASTWDLSHVNVSDCAGWGFNLPGVSDSFFTACRAATCTAGGWFIPDQSNTRYTGCHAEWNGIAGPGWRIGWPSTSGYVTMAGCTAEHNGSDGFFFTGAQPGTAILSGCRAYGDGRNNGAGGGGYAGFRASAFGGQVIGTGVVASTSTSPSCPQYGASQVSSSNKMALNPALLAGATAATNDDGSNTRALVYTPFDTDASTVVLPADDGFLGWAYDPAMAANASNQPAAGTVIAVRVKVPACKITKLWVGINSAGSGLTSGQNLAGLYSSDGSALLSATADQTTPWASGFTPVSMSLVTPQVVPAGWVYVAWYANGTTVPKFQFAGSANLVNANLSNPAARFATGGTGRTTSLPASLTLNMNADAYWAGVS